jgi:hypothetical protein
MAIVAAAWAASVRRTALAVGGAAVLLTVAFLSHFGTISVGIPTAGAIGASLFALGRGAVRRTGALLLVATVAASAVAYQVYYSHFTDVYRGTLARISETKPSPDGMVRSPASRLADSLRVSGPPHAKTASVFQSIAVVLGGVFLWRARSRDALTLTLAGWAAGFFAMWLVGILTTIQLRTSLSAAPMFVLLAAAGLARGARLSSSARAIATLATVTLVCAGGALWLTWLRP